MNLSTPFSKWWCCLRPTDRNCIVLMVGAYFTNEEYMSESTYTAITVLTGEAGLTLVNQYFDQHYGLTHGFVLDEEGMPVPVVFFDSELWALLYAFSLTDDFLCPNPCTFFEFWT